MASAQHYRDLWRPDFATLSDGFDLFAALGEDFGAYAAWPTLDDYNRLAAACGVVTTAGQPVRFVKQAPKPRARSRRVAAASGQAAPAYEQRVLGGEVPTRLGHWHDFFNMLAWCVFPRAKAALNARQVAGGVGARTEEQNRLAMFDEGGVVNVIFGDSAQDSPADRRPRRLIFGHALHELTMRGGPGATGWHTTVMCDAALATAPVAALVTAVDVQLGAAIAAGQMQRTPMRAPP